MIEQVQALWRPITGFIMAAVVLLVAMGWLPEAAQAHADTLLTAAGAVLMGLTGARGVQRVAEVKAEAAKVQAQAKIVEMLRAQIAAAKP